MEIGEISYVGALLKRGNELQARADLLEARAARVRTEAIGVFERTADEILETRGVTEGNHTQAAVSPDEFIELAFGIYLDDAGEEVEATYDLIDNVTNRAGERILVVQGIGEITMLNTGYISTYEPKFYLSRATSSRTGKEITGMRGEIGITAPTAVTIRDYSVRGVKSRMANCYATKVYRSDDTVTIAASSGISHRGMAMGDEGGGITRSVFIGTEDIDDGLQSLGHIRVISGMPQTKNYLGVGKLFGGILQAEYDALAHKLPSRGMYDGDLLAPVAHA